MLNPLSTVWVPIDEASIAVTGYAAPIMSGDQSLWRLLVFSLTNRDLEDPSLRRAQAEAVSAGLSQFCDLLKLLGDLLQSMQQAKADDEVTQVSTNSLLDQNEVAFAGV